MIDIWVSPEIMQRFAGSLLHFFWQGAVIAMLAALAFRLTARRPAEWRYAVSVAALLSMFAAPIMTFVFYTQTGALARRLLQWVGETVTQRAQPGANAT